MGHYFLVATTFLLVFSKTIVSAHEVAIRWASTGGGWRSQFACIGFANVFQQAGLLSLTSSKISGVSTTSGASWFSTQFFYSSEFYFKTVLATPDELYTFVEQWMSTYYTISTDVDEETKEICNTTDIGQRRGRNEIVREVCYILQQYNGDWASFVHAMLEEASIGYGDENFVKQTATSANFVTPLKSTELVIQSALAPNSKIRAEGNFSTSVFLGHEDKENGGSVNLYSVVLPSAFLVNASWVGFHYGFEDRSNHLKTYTEKISVSHNFSDWSDLFLYPGTNGTVEVSDTRNVTPTDNEFREPFGGRSLTNVVQLAAISSAAAGSFSGIVPSVFTQSFSEQAHTIEETNGVGSDARGTTFSKTIDRIYQNTFYDDFAVCSQWPDPCGENDGYFIDGWFADNPALAINIGQYHESSFDDNNFKETKMKLILTITNQSWNSSSTFDKTQVLMFFNTTFNQNVDPGDFLWAPDHSVPYRSPQVFKEYMDEASLDALIQPIEGSNITTAVLNATTIDNPAFKVRAGQEIEILLLILNEEITTFVVGKTAIEMYTPRLADMTRNIASNQVLVDRVIDFASFEHPPSSPTADPSRPLPTASPTSAGHSSITVAGFLITELRQWSWLLGGFYFCICLW